MGSKVASRSRLGWVACMDADAASTCIARKPRVDRRVSDLQRDLRPPQGVLKDGIGAHDDLTTLAEDVKNAPAQGWRCVREATF
jgi:hypothetical protein